METSFGARRGRDAGLVRRTAEVELTDGPLQVGGCDAAAEEAVVQVGVEAGRSGADLVIAHDRAGRGVAEGLRIQARGEVDVEHAAARERTHVVGGPGGGLAGETRGDEVRRDELFGESILQRLGREDVDDVTKVVALPEEVVLGVNQLLLARPILLNFLAVTNNTINYGPM